LKLYFLPWLFLADLFSKSLLPSSFVILVPFSSFALIPFFIVVLLTQHESQPQAT